MSTSPIRIRPRATLALAVAAAISVVAFGWPLLVSADADIARGTTAPWTFALLLPLVLAVVLAEISEGGLDAKAVAMLGVLSALGAAIRPLGAGTAGIETVFFLLVLGGRVFGPGFGFVLGNTMLFASALLTGGVGPWLPYQMLGAAWVALGAGLLPSMRVPSLGGRAELAMLAAYSAAASLVYGLLLNLSFWPFALGAGATSLSYQPGGPILDNLVRVVAFSLATSLGWDVGRAITTTILVLATGPVLLRTLRRAARKASFGEPVFSAATAPQPPPARPAPPA
ncbi:ECF transporter S component [Saccharothrix sp. ALI-22-I]|uniref:ECF transporter S component n=1 Tax=Saccharothrix sp. ALI-22-I TaxID=1933778 RepID=UPI000A04BEBE|nr:ECF transporter S component [Saccharothrix sp. ALI-22-I]